MGHKNVCLNCRKAFNMGTDYNNIREADCPECGRPMILMSHRFRPPKKTDDKKWLTVEYLIENGFKYQHVYKKNEAGQLLNTYADYPNNLRDAKEFVDEYKEQAQKK